MALEMSHRGNAGSRPHSPPALANNKLVSRPPCREWSALPECIDDTACARGVSVGRASPNAPTKVTSSSECVDVSSPGDWLPVFCGGKQVQPKVTVRIDTSSCELCESSTLLSRCSNDVFIAPEPRSLRKVRMLMQLAGRHLHNGWSPSSRPLLWLMHGMRRRPHKSTHLDASLTCSG